MHNSEGTAARSEGRRRLARTRPGVAVECLEGRQLLSHMGTMPGHHQHGHQAQVSTLDDNGGEVRKDPHYFEIFDNIGKRPDLNVVRASVKLHEDAKVLTFQGEMQAKINTAPANASQNSLFVFGVNRGSPKAIAPFALRPGVVFDSLVIVTINNATGISASAIDLAGGTRTVISADHIHIEGKKVRVDVDPALLPTPAGGVSVEHYTFNLWPREAGGPDSTIASFIPENSMAPIAVEGHQHGH
jgi:hypothetical protein